MRLPWRYSPLFYCNYSYLKFLFSQYRILFYNNYNLLHHQRPIITPGDLLNVKSTFLLGTDTFIVTVYKDCTTINFMKMCIFFPEKSYCYLFVFSMFRDILILDTKSVEVFCSGCICLEPISYNSIMLRMD